MKIAFLLSIFCYSCIHLSFETRGSVKIRGTLICPSEPAKAQNLRVKLLDKDDMSIDDLMQEGFTDAEGHFTLQGSADDPIGTIDPYLKFSHTCNNKHLVGKRQWNLRIPDQYINGDWMEAGVINLEFYLDEDHEILGK